LDVAIFRADVAAADDDAKRLRLRLERPPVDDDDDGGPVRGRERLRDDDGRASMIRASKSSSHAIII
jgi:hypothetical protein